jgi:hypothetical protein
MDIDAFVDDYLLLERMVAAGLKIGQLHCLFLQSIISKLILI